MSATATARVIADGQEDLVRQMFAAPLPEHWRFADARIEPARIVARYKRARDGAAVEFVLSAAVPGARLRTERFAIDIRSTQAAGDVTPLVRAVLASVRAVEATFVWTELCAPPPRPPPPPPPPPQSALSTASAPDPFEAMLVARYEPFRVAATIAPIGAVVADMNAGSSAGGGGGLGFQAVIYSAQAKYPALFATAATTTTATTSITEASSLST